MPYDTATATDVDDLLDKFRLFLIAAGWTVDYWGDPSAGAGKVLSVHHGARFYTLASDPTLNPTSVTPGPYITVRLHTAFGTGGSLAQPGVSEAVIANRLTGPMQSYRFFADAPATGAYAYMAVETDPGTYRHIGIGALRPMGAIADAGFAFASNWNYSATIVSDRYNVQHGIPFDDANYLTGQRSTVLRADYDAISPRYHYVGGYSADRARGGWRADSEEYGTIFLPEQGGASTLTGRAPLLPLWCAVDRSAGLWTDVGYPPDMRFVRIDDAEPGAELALGADTWVVLPIARKNGTAGQPNTGGWGYAYRKVP